MIYNTLFKVRNSSLTWYIFYCCLSTCISWKTFEFCGFSCVVGYLLYFLNIYINHFIPPIVLNCVLWNIHMLQPVWCTGQLTWRCLLIVICMFVWAVGTTEYRLSKLIMGKRCMNNPKHQPWELILWCIHKTAWYLPQLMFILRHSLCAVLFLWAVFVSYTSCDITYRFPVLLPGISTRNPMCSHILKYDGLWTVDEYEYVTEYCIQVCIFKYENK
jgi:hypothetical protein